MDSTFFESETFPEKIDLTQVNTRMKGQVAQNTIVDTNNRTVDLISWRKFFIKIDQELILLALQYKQK